MISNDVLKLIEDDFSNLQSKRSMNRFDEDLNQLKPLLIQVRSQGISLHQISSTLKTRGIKIPHLVLRKFIQENGGEKKKIRAQKNKKIQRSPEN